MARESHAHRIERILAAQRAVGLPENRQAAQGHFKESPLTRSRADAYKAAYAASKVGGRVDTQGRVYLTTTAGYDAALSTIAARSPEAHIYLQVDDVTIYKHGGIDAATLANVVKTEYKGNWDLMANAEAEKQKGQSPKKRKNSVFYRDRYQRRKERTQKGKS